MRGWVPPTGAAHSGGKCPQQSVGLLTRRSQLICAEFGITFRKLYVKLRVCVGVPERSLTAAPPHIHAKWQHQCHSGQAEEIKRHSVTFFSQCRSADKSHYSCE